MKYSMEKIIGAALIAGLVQAQFAQADDNSNSSKASTKSACADKSTTCDTGKMKNGCGGKNGCGKDGCGGSDEAPAKTK